MSTHPKPENHYARRFAQREYLARLARRVGVVEAKLDPKAAQQTHPTTQPLHPVLTLDLLRSYSLHPLMPLMFGGSSVARPPCAAELVRLGLVLLRHRLTLSPEDLPAALAVIVPAAQAARLWDLARTLPTICEQQPPEQWALSLAEAALEITQAAP